ncbi:MAG: hypothetical protein ACOCWB_01710 [Bacteroidota bacterium]
MNFKIFGGNPDSRLQKIEMCFNFPTQVVVKDGVRKSSQQLANQLMEYVKTYNKTKATPFKWI